MAYRPTTSEKIRRNHRRAGLRIQRGFTLLEVTIAVALLTVLTLGAALVYVPVARQTRVNREVATANMEVRRVLEKVHALPFNKIVSTHPDGQTIGLGSLPSGQLVIDYADPAADPLVLTATLSWESPDLGTMQRTYTTVRTE